MVDKSQLNRGIFLVSKIVCSVCVLISIGMCFLPQVAIKTMFGRETGGWIDVFQSFDEDGFFVIGIVMFIIMMLLIIACIICSWLNVPLVSVIGIVLCVILNVVYWVVLISRFSSLYGVHYYPYIGFYLVAVFCTIGGVFANIQFTYYLRWKKGISTGSNLYYTPPQPMQQPIQNNLNNFSGNAAGDQHTVLLDEDMSAIQKPQPKKTAPPSTGSITGLSGSCAGYQLQLHTGEHIIIGKDAKLSNIVIDSSYQAVSRRHVGISYDSGRGKYCVTDYSSNGTFVNGERLVKDKVVFLSPGTELKIADDKNMFLLG